MRLQEGRFKFCIEAGAVTLASIFEEMEARKEAMGVLDYSASQPPLESVFLSFVHTDGRASVADPGELPELAEPASPLEDGTAAAATPPTAGRGSVLPTSSQRLGLFHGLFATAQPRVRSVSVELSSTRQAGVVESERV